MTAADTKIARAEHARRILEDELFTEAFAAIERDAFAKWRNSSPEDTETRDAAYWELRALVSVRQKLRAVMSDGSVALFDRSMIERKKSNG